MLEEINRVPSDTVSVLYPLLLERKINGHCFAPGWKIGVTMNPDTVNYSVNSLDDAMLDRFVTIEVTADLDDYIEYSMGNSSNDDVLAFLEACPDMLLVVKKSADATATSKSPTPRGWTKVQEIMNNCSIESRLLKRLIAGVVGPESAAAFYGFLKNREFRIPSAEKLLKNSEDVRPVVMDILAKNRLDAISRVEDQFSFLQRKRDVRLRLKGDIPGEVAGQIADLYGTGEVNWRNVLKRFLLGKGRTVARKSFKKESKRFENLPGNKRSTGVNALLALDESGSISEAQTQEFCSEVLRLSRITGASISVTQFDTDCTPPVSLERFAKHSRRVKKGGTDFRPVFSLADSIRVPLLIVFTDGEGTAPPYSNQKGLWILTG